MGGVGDGANGVCDRTERGAMCGCGPCEASWKREEVDVGCEGRGVNDELDEPFACSGREATWEHKTSEVAV
jgi:hypothetical protein